MYDHVTLADYPVADFREGNTRSITGITLPGNYLFELPASHNHMCVGRIHAKYTKYTLGGGWSLPRTTQDKGAPHGWTRIGW